MGGEAMALSDQHISILLSTASTYADSAAKSFGLFITVLFASLAFAETLAKKGGWTSRAFVPISVALIAFYVINFIAFQSANGKLTIVLQELSSQIEHWNFKNPGTLSVFRPEKPIIGSLGLPSIGYLIGSVLGFAGFVRIASTVPVPVRRSADEQTA